MLTDHFSQEEIQVLFHKIYEIISAWNNQKHKYSRKYGFDRIAVVESNQKIPFSILRDNAGNFYLMENDKTKTKSEERKGSEGRYKLLQKIILNDDKKTIALMQSAIGVKIEKEIKHQNPKQTHSFFSPASGDPMFDIFGNTEVEEKYKADEIGALKKVGLYIDDFYIENKHYILVNHVLGLQLLKFINTEFANASQEQQIELLNQILMACVSAIMMLHEKAVIHRDTQFKNFIRTENGSQCVLIDFGSAILSKDKLKQHEDFLCFKNQLDLIDPHLKNAEIVEEWQNFKKEFSRVIEDDKIKLAELKNIIFEFSDVAQKILQENRHSLKS